MIVGLGVGSTAIYAIRALAQQLAAKQFSHILAIPCAKSVEEEARRLQIPLTTFAQHPIIDVTIDGADEVDPQLNLIKGGGGALLREKIVAQASRREVILVDAAKQVPLLGMRWALPIEVIPFAQGSIERFLKELGGKPQLRLGSHQRPFRTDEGNYILDTNFGPIQDPQALARHLEGQAGIVEHGLFLNIATDVLVAETTLYKHYSIKGDHPAPICVEHSYKS
jgi:ribose 5-phosphate isomerase A